MRTDVLTGWTSETLGSLTVLTAGPGRPASMLHGGRRRSRLRRRRRRPGRAPPCVDRAPDRVSAASDRRAESGPGRLPLRAGDVEVRRPPHWPDSLSPTLSARLPGIQRTEFAGAESVRFAEGPAEDRRPAEAPEGRDDLYSVGAGVGAGEVGTTLLQAASSDPGMDGWVSPRPWSSRCCGRTGRCGGGRCCRGGCEPLPLRSWACVVVGQNPRVDPDVRRQARRRYLGRRCVRPRREHLCLHHREVAAGLPGHRDQPEDLEPT